MRLKYFAVVMLTVVLTACGNKGALMLENKDEDKSSAQSKLPVEKSTNQHKEQN